MKKVGLIVVVGEHYLSLEDTCVGRGGCMPKLKLAPAYCGAAW